MAQELNDLLARFTPQQALDRDSLMFVAGQQSRRGYGWKIAVAVLGLSQLVTLGVLAFVFSEDSPTPLPPVVKPVVIWGPLEPNHWEPLEVAPTPEPQGYPQPYSTTPMIPDDPPLFAGTILAKHLDQ